MKHLLNSLFVNNELAYATLDGENIVLKQGDILLGRFPLHILQSVFLFTYSGASPALMGKCAELGIELSFFSPSGRFLARSIGKSRGNVLLRREQYRIADNEERCCAIARNMIFGKISNARQVLNRVRRDHGMQIDVNQFKSASDSLNQALEGILKAKDIEYVRGIEGACASIYFNLFDDMILRNKEDFKYVTRNRRPPLDPVNALLSYVYSMLSSDCASALEGVGLDSYVGFLHKDRPGRTSLALDLMEELRPCMADRFVLSLLNNRIIHIKDFDFQESGAVYLTSEGRKRVQKEWQDRKKTKIDHPYLKEKTEWGMVPYVQALLLARYIRGDMEGYPPFLWK